MAESYYVERLELATTRILRLEEALKNIRDDGAECGGAFCAAIATKALEQQAPRPASSSLEQGGISDRLANFDDYGDRIRDRS